MAQEQSIHVEAALVEGLLTDPRRLLAVIRAVAESAMAAEVTRHVGAEPHQRTGDRVGRRNGYKPRTLQTRVGTLDLDVPQVRGCEPYHPSLFGRWQRSERALLVTCAEMYFQGVSTRNVRQVLEVMCGGDVSATTVSQVARELDERLAAFRTRRLDEHSYPYVKVDARYERVREGNRVVSRAVLVTIGYTEQGMREVLDWRVADSESEASWGRVFGDLKDRGLAGVKVLVSDAHRGRPGGGGASPAGGGVAAVPGAPEAGAPEEGELQTVRGADGGRAARVRRGDGGRVPAARRGNGREMGDAGPGGGVVAAGRGAGLPDGAVAAGGAPLADDQHQRPGEPDASAQKAYAGGVRVPERRELRAAGRGATAGGA